MVLLPPAPQAGASASSATSAWPCKLEGMVRLKPDTTFFFAVHYFAGAGAGAGAAGAGVAGAGVAGAEFAGAGAGAAGFVVAGAGAGVPLTTDLVPPRWPSTDNVSANSMNNTAAIDVALVSIVAPDRAPNAAWLLLPPKALAMSPPRPC